MTVATPKWRKPFAQVLADIEAAINDPARQKTARCATPGCEAVWTYPEALTAEPATLCEKCDAEERYRKATERMPILLSAGVPELFRQPFIPPDPWPASGLSDWAGTPWCVVLAGVVEGGKTMLGTELMYRAALRRGRDACWIRAGSVPRLCFDRETGSQAFERFATCSVLLLDDFGRGHEGKAWNVLVEIVSERHQHQRPTIFTSNRPLTRRNDREPPGLLEEDAAAGRRMAEGIVAVIRHPWKGGAA